MHRNLTGNREFFLRGFQELRPFRHVLFGVITLVYILTILWNFLIIFLVWRTPHLHHPMYYFLCHLSLSDIISMTNVVPNMLHITLNNGGTISFSGCMVQFQVYGESICGVCILLAVMSYDRYLAVCRPLHYSLVMDVKLQDRLAVLTWLSSFLVTFNFIVQMSLMTFCNNKVIDHYFCDIDPILGLSCSDVFILKIQVFLFAGTLDVSPLIFIVVTYLYIAGTILKISSSTGRQKAFYTCSSHLTVVCVYYGSLMAIYLSSHGQASNVKKYLSLLNTVGTPLLNPIIYSLRNKEIKAAIHRLIKMLKHQVFHQERTMNRYAT